MRPTSILGALTYVSSLAATVVLISCHNHNDAVTPATTVTLLPGSWDKLGDFEGEARTNAVSFVIGNFTYIGTGYDDSSKRYYNDFWKYDATVGSG